ncbi:hypothetical protein QE383_001123 [Pseudoxanthomonas winnipegensis]|uniref:Uncharacterized protein n=1 Tax=Pseudoxanthomonas winnipegensis TaxID=2480810 RepID=A0AAW8GC32_9GAMM|nr:hypothetical protein [Pseudoxanthomonas winnipegensis]
MQRGGDERATTPQCRQRSHTHAESGLSPAVRGRIADLLPRPRLHAPAVVQHPHAQRAAVRAAGSSQPDHVRVRPHRLQLRAHRQRARPGGVRRAGAAAAPPLWRPALRAQHHRRGRQDQRRRGRTGRADQCHHRQVRRGLPGRHGGPGRGAAGHRAGGHRAHPADRRHDRAAHCRRPRLRRRRARAVLGRLVRPLRPALAPRPGRTAGRRARGRGAVQARRRRLRAVEAFQRRAARLGLALGPRPAGLAHRVLGHGRRPPGHHHRHPRRRRGPAVSPPRERGRAERVRARRGDLRALLAAQRHAQLRRRQDEQVAGQHRARARPAAAAPAPRRCATPCSRRTTASRWTGRTR